MNIKEQIEREAERYARNEWGDAYKGILPDDIIQKGEDAYANSFIKGANFALEMDRWVKVEDGLPEVYAETPNCSIDCLITDGVIADTAYLKYSTNTWIVCSTQKPFTGDPVTHWQPLKLPQ